jgi:ketosteroid isomerase-like protein
MKNYLTDHCARNFLRNALLLLTAAAVLLACASPAAAQKDKKKKNDQTPPADSASPLIPMSDEQQIDYMVSEMLGAWQLGDIEKLHKDYADDVVIVSGAYAPPLIGWTNYLALYKQQKARMLQVRMDRSNTFIKVSGNFGWACYQWDFAAVVDGEPITALGQTTLVVQKLNNHWVIVHNHTSMVPSAQANTPATAQPPPIKPS